MIEDEYEYEHTEYIPTDEEAKWDRQISVAPNKGEFYQFLRGIEVGRLVEMFKDPDPFEQVIRAVNVEDVMQLMDKTGREAHVEDTSSPDWLVLYVESV